MHFRDFRFSDEHYHLNSGARLYVSADIHYHNGSVYLNNPDVEIVNFVSIDSNINCSANQYISLMNGNFQFSCLCSGN